MAATDNNVMDRLLRALYPSDPSNLDGDWYMRTPGGSGGTPEVLLARMLRGMGI